MTRPRVVLSRCLELDACRYNGAGIRSAIVRALEPRVELVPVCPEVEIGLGVPRDPIRIEASDGDADGVRLVQPSTGRDLTDRMLGFARSFAAATEAVDGLLLKSRSPSCGLGDVKVYAGGAPVTDRGTGMFAVVMRERYPDAAAEDEARLTDPEVRHHWLTRVFASARLREAVGRGPAGLVGFHTRYKLVLMAHAPAAQRELGRLVAEAGRADDFDALADDYRAGLSEALAEPAGRGATLNAVEHAQGYFKEEPGGAEERELAALGEQYRDGRLPFQALLAVLAGRVERFGEPYLREQWFFRPYPASLLETPDPVPGPRA